jgi:hypothetical protein
LPETLIFLIVSPPEKNALMPYAEYIKASSKGWIGCVYLQLLNERIGFSAVSEAEKWLCTTHFGAKSVHF